MSRLLACQGSSFVSTYRNRPENQKNLQKDESENTREKQCLQGGQAAHDAKDSNTESPTTKSETLFPISLMIPLIKRSLSTIGDVDLDYLPSFMSEYALEERWKLIRTRFHVCLILSFIWTTELILRTCMTYTNSNHLY